MTKNKLIVAAVAILAVGLIGWRWLSRGDMEADDPSRAAASSAGAPAAVARVTRRNLGDTLTVSGAFKPFQDVDVHAKVAGYIRTISVDVGDRVQQGQTLAILEVPELAAQLAGAEAATRAAEEQIRRALGDLQRAQSSQSAAHSAYVRLKQAADSRAGLVAQQEVDDSQAKDLESAAQVASAEAALSAAKQQLEVAQANRKQYAALSDYTRIVAPFAGVITNRYADTGALVAAGTSIEHAGHAGGSSRADFRIAAGAADPRVRRPHRFASARSIRVHVQALNQDFEGKVSRFADALNEQTRTMETEDRFRESQQQADAGHVLRRRTFRSRRETQCRSRFRSRRSSRTGDEAIVLVRGFTECRRRAPRPVGPGGQYAHRGACRASVKASR